MSFVTLILWLLSVLPSSFAAAILPIMASTTLLDKETTTQSDTIHTEEQSADMPITHLQTTLPAPKGALYNDPTSNAAVFVTTLSDPKQREALQPIVNTPTGIWQTKHSEAAEFSQKMSDASRLGQLPIVVFYNIPNIGCGSSGAATLQEYKNWVDERAAAMSSTPSIVIIEPDAVAMFDCLDQSQLEVRKNALNYAVDAVVAAGSTPYLDAGHANWESAEVMAKRLVESGLERTRGISVNVSNYQTNEASEAYARSVIELSRISGLGAVIDTSRNGNGPPADQQWCNAKGMRLGAPSTIVNKDVVDAYLWIKVPGESDGTGANCSNSPVAEGQFWLEYALDLL